MLDKDKLDAMSWDEVKTFAKDKGVHYDPSISRGELQRRILEVPDDVPETLSPDREGEPVATMVAPSPTGPINSVEIGDAVVIDPELDAPPEVEATYKFWVGTTEDAPFQNITCGITFPKFLGAYVGLDDNKDPLIPNTRGAIVALTSDEFEMVKRKVANTVVRSAGKKHILKVKTNKRFRAMPGDTPVGKFLYMRRIGEGMRYDFNTEQPEPMVI